MSDYEVKNVSTSGDNVHITLGPVSISGGDGAIGQAIAGALVFAVAALIFLPFSGWYWLLSYFVAGCILSYFVFVPTMIASMAFLLISFLR